VEWVDFWFEPPVLRPVNCGRFFPATGPGPLAGLSAANRYQAPGVGHGLLDSDDWAVELTRAFLEAPPSLPQAACRAGQ